MRIMRKFIDLVEAPLADYRFIGDKEEGSFRPEDIKAANSPAWYRKLENMFSKTPFNFNIYVVNTKDGMARIGGANYEVRNVSANLEKYAGEIDYDRAGRFLKMDVIPDKQYCITAILVENEGTNRISLTPWITAHRIVHAIIESDNFRIRDTISKIGRTVSNIVSFSEQYLIKQKPQTEVWDLDDYNKQLIDFYEVVSILGKMKSAKQKKLNSPGEFGVELITQYITTGSVTFNKPDVDDKGRSQKNPRDEDNQTDTDVFVNTLEQYETMLNRSIEELLTACVGKIFIL